MKRLKTVLSVVLCLITLSAFFCAFAASDTESRGTCGSFVGYTLNGETGELHLYLIGGAKSAAMANFKSGESPFFGNTAIKTVSIDAWINSIGSEAFSGCVNLTHVDIPFTVREIGANAFSDCKSATFAFDGTAQKWKDVSFGKGNDWKDDMQRVQFLQTALDRVGVTFRCPIVGEKVLLNAAVDVEDAAKYEAVLCSVYYYQNACRVYLREGEVYPASKELTFEIAFVPKEGYALEDETLYYVNGAQQKAVFGTVAVTGTPAQSASPDESKRIDEAQSDPQEEALCPRCHKDHSNQPLGFLLLWFHTLLNRFFPRTM